jgi:hypothetical protein
VNELTPTTNAIATALWLEGRGEREGLDAGIDAEDSVAGGVSISAS